MTEPFNARQHTFIADLVHQDLDAHRDLWQTALFEEQSSEHHSHPEWSAKQTTCFLVPAQGMDALLMQLVARWYPNVLLWVELRVPLFLEIPPASKKQVLVAQWSE
jgi:hypothetical protein